MARSRAYGNSLSVRAGSKMSIYTKNTSNRIVSALDSVLKLLTDVYKKIRFLLGCLLIDNILRSVLHWYDKRHPDSKRKDSVCSEETLHLNEKIRSLQSTISELERRIGIFKSQEISFNKQRDSWLADIRGKDNEISNLSAENKHLLSQTAGLQDENQKLLRRCLPETEIPSMIYYAQGDAVGLYLRKISSVRTPDCIYRITTSVGDTSVATFEPYVESNIQDIIINRNLTLIACDIIRIDSNASSIHVCEAGKVICENNKWKVISKAKIILS